MNRLQKCFLLNLLFILSITAFNIKEALFGNSKTQDIKQHNTFGAPETTSKSNRPDMPCKDYICKDTEACVSSPVECPCRLTMNKKCMIGDWYTCIRGDLSCSELDKA
ncbi:hypothetical protein AB4K20DRAFT_1915217 [Rhizopus microsporus]|uniref:Long chronological lifespan protein 2 n=1 Tax=Rhizopus microsporus TaxID=58291 RepID=A0A1X0S4I0_RHIZD|nr:hypothetical protein BCV71DRAFT_226477 [Rhizopus microsporus]